MKKVGLKISKNLQQELKDIMAFSLQQQAYMHKKNRT
jgi:hypothetical protein